MLTCVGRRRRWLTIHWLASHYCKVMQQSGRHLFEVVCFCHVGASEPKNMAYMSRLGIWGPGTPFREFSDFIQAVERRSVKANPSCVNLIIVEVIKHQVRDYSQEWKTGHSRGVFLVKILKHQVIFHWIFFSKTGHPQDAWIPCSLKLWPGYFRCRNCWGI